jgi:hypothetical protein
MNLARQPLQTSYQLRSDWALDRLFGYKRSQEEESLRTPNKMGVVLDPAHPDFQKLMIDKPAPFACDPRLLG